MKTLETDRLILRDWKQEDLEDFFAYASVEGVGEMAGWPHHQNREETQKILQIFLESKEEYAIVWKENHQVIGSLGIHNRPFAPYPAEIQREIGYVLSKAFWGRGIMPEAVSAAVAYAMEELKVEALWCCHMTHNDRSRRVIEKCGFTFYADGEYNAKMLGKTFPDKRYLLTPETYATRL